MAKYTVHAIALVNHTVEVEADSPEEAVELWRNTPPEAGVLDEITDWEDPHGYEVDGEYFEFEPDDDITEDA